MFKMGHLPLIMLLSFLSVTAVPVTVLSAEIKVVPGIFDHFNVTLPQQTSAGENVEIKLMAVDRLNNPTKNFGTPNRKFVITVSGSASVTPSSFDATSIGEGGIWPVINDKVAEIVTMSVFEDGQPVPLFSRTLTVVPDKIASLVIKAPAGAVAGEKFDIGITKKDRYGNVLGNHASTSTSILDVQFKGTTEPRSNIPLAAQFKYGVGTVELKAEKAGSLIVEVKEMESGISGTSEKIEITNAPLHSFKILHPNEVIAGESFDFTVIPVDRFGNAVFNYSSTGNGIAINSHSGLAPFPSNIPAYTFANGQAKIALRYDGAGAARISVSEINGIQTGRSDDIKFIPPVIDRFEVVTPDSVVAGQKFKAKIVAYNQQSRVIKNYSVIGRDVLLSVTGTGVLTPGRIPPSQFVDGIAVIELQYNKPESFEINAALEKKAARETAAKPVAAKAAEEKGPKPVEKPVESVSTPVAEMPAAESLKPASAPDNVKPVPQKKQNSVKSAGKSFYVLDFSIDEQGGKATANIHLDGTPGKSAFKVNAENKDGESWIVAKLKPAKSKMGDYNKDVASSFVSNIEVQEDKGTVIVKMKLWAPAHYNAYVKDNDIKIKLLKNN